MVVGEKRGDTFWKRGRNWFDTWFFDTLRRERGWSQCQIRICLRPRRRWPFLLLVCKLRGREGWGLETRISIWSLAGFFYPPFQGMSIQYYWYFQYFQNGIGYWYFQYFWNFCQIKVLVLNTFILLWPTPNTFYFKILCVFLRFSKRKLVFAENSEMQLLL